MGKINDLTDNYVSILQFFYTESINVYKGTKDERSIINSEIWNNNDNLNEDVLFEIEMMDSTIAGFVESLIEKNKLRRISFEIIDEILEELSRKSIYEKQFI